MRKSTLIIAGLIGLSSSLLATEPDVFEIPANFGAWNLNFKLPLEKLPVPENPTPAKAPVAKPGEMRAICMAAGETKEFFVAAQTYHKNYVFQYEGGAIATYPIDITVDGDKVTISRLFNLEAQSTEYSKGVDYDITGTYDSSAGTITIPTSTNFENATIVGTIGDYFTEVLVAGVVSEDGKLAPQNELVFNVIGDFEAITTDTSFGIMNYDNAGTMPYGTQTLYRGFYATLPTEEPKLVAFNDTYTFPESFAGQGMTGQFSLVNVSDTDVDYATEFESDGNTFSVNPDGGSIPARSIQDFDITFMPNETGEYEGMLSIQYDGMTTTPEPIYVLYAATAIPTPDYSDAVKTGDFTFTTNIEYPFEITSLEDGTKVARSTTNGSAGTSKLSVEFVVPEDNIGVFSWKGLSNNTGYYYQNAGGYFIDNADAPAMSYNGPNDDISGSIEFAPGKHSVRFQYEGLAYTGDEKNGLYVYDLELVNSPAESDAVVIETPELNLGNLLIKDENGVSSEGTIIIRNKGLNALSVNNVTSSNPAFTATKPNSQAGLLETIEIPVMLNTNEAGKPEAEIAIETSAGTVKASVKALVRKMADFSSVVTEGNECVTGFTTNEAFPFEVENGVAYNANSGEADDVATSSWFQIDFTIPEGKAGYLSWDGNLFGHSSDPESYWVGDGGLIYINHPMTSGSLNVYPNETDASSKVFADDESWSSFLVSVPGTHSIRFEYNKNGDGIISEKDCLEISNFRIRVEEFKEHDVEADKTEVTFEPIYVGENRYLTTTIKLKNTGSMPLEVLECTADAPFYGVLPENKFPIQWNNSMEVGLWFYPAEEGEYSGTVTFKTNAGDVEIQCYGSTKDAEGILLIGDVENQATGWSFYDADGDGLCWNLGYNLWGVNPEWVHEGSECFGSVSYDPYTGGINPNNWLFSPTVGIPEDGAMLRWYAAAHHHERYAENYSVYISTPEFIEDPANLETLEPMFTETLSAEAADTWQEHTLDLSAFAGQNVTVIFRHHDCDGQYVLKIDDIFVYDMEKWNELQSDVKIIDSDASAISTETFDINGIRTRGLVKGVNIIRTTYSDGTVKTSKIVVK